MYPMSNAKPREVAMKVSKAATIWIDYHRAHSKKNTVRSYTEFDSKFSLESQWLLGYQCKFLDIYHLSCRQWIPETSR